MAKATANSTSFRRATRMNVGGSSSAPNNTTAGPRPATTARKTARGTGSQLQPSQIKDSEDDDDDDETESPRGIPARRGRRLVRETEVSQQDRFPTVTPGSESDRTLAAPTPARQPRQRVVLGNSLGAASRVGGSDASAPPEDSGGINNTSASQGNNASRRLPRAALPESDGDDDALDAPQQERARKTAPSSGGARKSAPSTGPGFARIVGGQRRHRQVNLNYVSRRRVRS